MRNHIDRRFFLLEYNELHIGILKLGHEELLQVLLDSTDIFPFNRDHDVLDPIVLQVLKLVSNERLVHNADHGAWILICKRIKQVVSCSMKDYSLVRILACSRALRQIDSKAHLRTLLAIVLGDAFRCFCRLS